MLYLYVVDRCTQASDPFCWGIVKEDSLIAHLNVIKVVTDRSLDFLNGSVGDMFTPHGYVNDIGVHDILDQY